MFWLCIQSFVRQPKKIERVRGREQQALRSELWVTEWSWEMRSLGLLWRLTALCILIGKWKHNDVKRRSETWKVQMSKGPNQKALVNLLSLVSMLGDMTVGKRSVWGLEIKVCICFYTTGEKYIVSHKYKCLCTMWRHRQNLQDWLPDNFFETRSWM